MRSGTICYPDGHKVEKGDIAIDETEALCYLEHDLNRTAVTLWKFLERQPTLNQWSALLSLAYNVGVTAVSRSTVLRMFNAGRDAMAALHFVDWDKARVDGQLVEIKGLKNRREAEAKLYLTA